MTWFDAIAQVVVGLLLLTPSILHRNTLMKVTFVPAKKEPIGKARYIHRAQAVKRVNPTGIYAQFNLSTNTRASDKPSIEKGSALFG